ncbi:MAG: hypothetical protein VX346_00320 [Planctomycetota bacterium]|nr:hypothetical protein [Planctomycetota bacterium]
MKSKPYTLPRQPGRLITLALCAQTICLQGLAEQTQGKTLVLRAAKQLLQLPSFETRIRQTIDLAGQQLVGTGTYRQSGTSVSPLIRMELRVQTANGVASLQQIRNQRFLWIRRAFIDHTVLERIDLKRVNEALAQNRPVQDKIAPLNLELASWIARGGIPSLLVSLEQHFKFGVAQTRKIDRVDVWQIMGQWKTPATTLSDRARQTTSQDQAPSDDAIRPDRVRLLLGQNRPVHLFPYQIVFFREDKGASRPIVSIDFFDIRKVPEVDRAWFEYQPGNQDVDDLTEPFLMRLGIPRGSTKNAFPVSGRRTTRR